jgi:hypothetical protein
MAVGFDGVLFSCYPDGDGYLPEPAAGEGNNPDAYQATVRLTAANLALLIALKSVATTVPAIGFVSGGTVVVEAGVGARTLIYPGTEGDEVTVSAILTDVAPVAHLLHDEVRAELTFLLVDTE